MRDFENVAMLSRCCLFFLFVLCMLRFILFCFVRQMGEWANYCHHKPLLKGAFILYKLMVFGSSLGCAGSLFKPDFLIRIF